MPPSPTPPPEPQRGASITTAYVAGILRSIPFLIVIGPFGLVFGVAATDTGLSFWQIAGFSTIVLAGAAQITALQLMVEQAPLVIVILSALAVNLRMAMYSAAMVPWLGRTSAGMRALIAYVLIDQTFALSLKQFEDNPQMSHGQRLAYFFGTSTVLALTWPLFTALGATLGRTIPAGYALDFAVPITFLAMVSPQLRSVPHLVAAVVGFGLSAALSGLPSGLNLIIAGPVAMAVGAELERRQARRAGVAA